MGGWDLDPDVTPEADLVAENLVRQFAHMDGLQAADRAWVATNKVDVFELEKLLVEIITEHVLAGE